MNKIIFILFLIIYYPSSTYSQYSEFIKSGKIIFERKVNTFGALPIFLSETKQVPKEQLSSVMQQYKTSAPQFWIDSFALYFDNKESIYQSLDQNITFSPTFAIPIAYKNIVYSNFTSGEVRAEKQLFEKAFFVKDSIRKISWKLTDETRKIAGFECRRANALLFDSIYVVAFYTDEIPLKSGPEMFNGLPGMILGVALPYQHITWFAKNIVTGEALNNWKQSLQSGRASIRNIDYCNLASEKLKEAKIPSKWVEIFMNL